MTTTLDHRPPPRLRELPLPDVRSGSADRSADRRDRHGLALSELFSARGDLGGVSLVADVLAEDLLWSA